MTELPSFADPDPGLRVERDGALEVWTLARDARRNALGWSTVSRLVEVAERADRDDTLRAVIIAGEGDRAFCSGADLKERRSMSEYQVDTFLGMLRRAFDAVDQCSKPVIAAVDGLALGGGTELALACDFRIAGPAAAFGLPEVSMAIIPGAGGTQRLTRLLGPGAAKEMILFSSRWDAEEAHRRGLVHRCAVDERAESLARRFVEPLLHAPPVAVGAALEAIDGAQGRPLSEGLDVERRCYARTLRTEDRREALDAFTEKRRPVFVGR